MASPEKRVLYISYFYPPFQSAGAARAGKLTKYLPRHGWRPTVLSPERDDLPATLPIEIPSEWIRATSSLDVNALPKLVLGRRAVSRHGFDPAVMPSRLPTIARLLLASSGRAYKQLINFPDGQIGWYPFAVAAGRRTVQELRPDVIFSSSPPATSHLVAATLSRRSGIPWVAEFRDLWTDNYNFRRVAPLLLLERYLEDRVVTQARALVTISNALATSLRARHKKPTFVIPNGFDPADYAEYVPPERNFQLAYTGNVYPGKQSARELFVALDRMRRRGELPSDFRVALAGRAVDRLVEEARGTGVADLIDVKGLIEHRAALDLQMRSTALLLLLWRDPSQDGVCPAKMFEYLGTGRPILALGPPSTEAGEIVRQSGRGVAVNTAEQVEETLRLWIAEHERAGELRSEALSPFVRRFEHPNLTGELARTLNEVAAG